MCEQNLHLSPLISNSNARVVRCALYFMVEVIPIESLSFHETGPSKPLRHSPGKSSPLMVMGVTGCSRCRAIPLVIQRLQYISKMEYNISPTEIENSCWVVRNYCVPNYARSVHNFHKAVKNSCYSSFLTHWGRVTHICVGKLTTIGSDNGLSPGRRQAIIWINAGILLIGPLETNFSEILIGIQTSSFKKIHLKMSSAKWRPFVSASVS